MEEKEKEKRREKLCSTAVLPVLRSPPHDRSRTSTHPPRPMPDTLHIVQLDEPSTRRSWRKRARRRRGQFPIPRKERGQWKIRYYTDVAQPDGTVRRVKKTKCLGRVAEMTLREAKKETARFLQPINDVEPGIEYAEKTLNDLVQLWERDVKPNLKRSTQESYEWGFKRIVPWFGPMPVSEIEKADVQSFLTASAKELAPEVGLRSQEPAQRASIDCRGMGLASTWSPSREREADAP